MNTLKKILPSILLLSAFVLLWELYCRLSGISKMILPSPSAIFQALVTNWPVLLIHTVQTVEEALIGLACAIFLGVSVAMLLLLLPSIRAGVYPLLVFSQTIPVIALAPLLLIWFGFDLTPKVIIVVLYCFFPIAIALSDAFFSTDQNAIALLKSMGASEMHTLIFVHIPNAIPAFFSGLKISVTYAIAGAIVGEYVGAYRGLGVYMQTSANSHATALVFAALAVTALITMLLLGSVSIAEYVCTPWKRIYD